MTTDEIIDLLKNFENMSNRDMTNAYNSLSVKERREFAEYLRDLPDNKTTFNKFKNDIAKQAIDKQMP